MFEARLPGPLAPMAALDIRKLTSTDLVRRITAIARQEQRGPRALFTLLCGAGVSLGAGMPSTAALVAAMRARRDALRAGTASASWSDLLDQSGTGSGTEASPGTTAEYQALFTDDDIFPSPLHRQRFISEAIVWASAQRAPLSTESLRIASILLAGAGRSAEIARGVSSALGSSSPTQLGGWLAHTLYTTNFDEVIPQTLRYCGEPVIIVDHAGAHGRLQGEPNYPRVAYLHGCHLHYSLRNTVAELGRADTDRTGGVDITGLFLRFRDVLRNTGLIVLGYSGWNDRAVLAIRDALADEESLPYGLYWGARFGEKSLSDTALQLLRNHSDRAFMLDEGKDASSTLENLCSGLGVPYERNLKQWVSRFSGVQTQFNAFAGTQPPSEQQGLTRSTPPLASKQSKDLQRDIEQSQLISEADAISGDNFDNNTARPWLARATAFVNLLREEGVEPSAMLLWFIGSFRRLMPDYKQALQELRAAYDSFEASGTDQSAAAILIEIAATLMALGQPAEATETARRAAARLKKLGQTDLHVIAISCAMSAARTSGQLDLAKKLAESAGPDADHASPSIRADFYDELARNEARSGELSEAERTATKALPGLTAPMARMNTLMLLGDIAVNQGDFEVARKRFKEAGALGRAIDEPVGQVKSEIYLGEAEMRAGRYRQADGHLARAEQLAKGRDLPMETRPYLKALWAEAAQHLGRPGNHEQNARAAISELTQAGSLNVLPYAQLSLARIQALKGHPEEALRTATAVLEDAGARHEILMRNQAESVIAQITSRTRTAARIGARPRKPARGR